MLLNMVKIKNIDTSKDVIHLLKIWHIYDEDPIVCAPSELEFIANKLDGMKDPTSDGALSLIWRECEKYLDSIGYADDRHRDRRNVIFAKNCRSDSEKKESAFSSECENLTTLDPASAPSSVTVKGGKIVSCALAHLCDGIYEICTETAPLYRGQGYATENVTALSDKLIQEGADVCYLCAEKNELSKRVAKRSGFMEIGMSYDYIVRRKG